MDSARTLASKVAERILLAEGMESIAKAMRYENEAIALIDAHVAEVTRPLVEALEKIAETTPLGGVLDPMRLVCIARHGLALFSAGGDRCTLLGCVESVKGIGCCKWCGKKIGPGS